MGLGFRDLGLGVRVTQYTKPSIMWPEAASRKLELRVFSFWAYGLTHLPPNRHGIRHRPAAGLPKTLHHKRWVQDV